MAAAAADVVVVEDEALVLLLLRDLFEDAGLRVETASDAEGALVLLRGAAEAHQPVGVLVTDVNLGHGPDGMELAAEARRRLPGLPVVYVTGNADLVAARGLGPGERLFAKPFDAAALTAEVQALARGRGGGDAPPGPAAR